MAVLTTEKFIVCILAITSITLYNTSYSVPSHDRTSSYRHHVFDYDHGIVPATPPTVGSATRNETLPYLSTYGSHRVEESFARLPEWLQTYFEWHGGQIRNNRTGDTKYVVVTCLKKCGGISDRLRPLPFYLLYASLVPRVVCIHWSLPFGLENYLVPPVDGAGRVVDWRCPPDVSEAYARKDKPYFDVNCKPDGSLRCYEGSIAKMKKSDDRYVFLGLRNYATERVNFVNQLFQLHSYADHMPKLGQWWFVESMGDIFRVMFEPVPTLARITNATMAGLGLRENEYVSVHVRSRYPVNNKFNKLDLGGGLKLEGSMKDYLVPIVDNAVRCGSHLAPNRTVYFASDSHEVVADAASRDIALDGGAHARPVAVRRDEEPLHSNAEHPGSEIGDFFPVFEDLLIMGGSGCVVHGLGSFGAFGAGLSGNRCRAIHRNYRGKSVMCPNDYTHVKCLSTVELFGGKMLFGSVIDGKRRLSSPLCDSLDTIKKAISNPNQTTLKKKT